MTNINKIFKSFNNLKVLVIGDVMIDRYLIGKVTRISPEAPVPILEARKEEERLGGAANVALNIRALGAKPILCSVIGNDKRGKEFLDLMKAHDLSNVGILQSKKRMTTSKSRVIANGQHLLRVDREQINNLGKKDEHKLLRIISHVLDAIKIDVILFQDYNKGILTQKVIKKLIKESKKRGIPTVVDPKFKNFWTYEGVTLFKPNLKEIRDALKKEVFVSKKSLKKASKILKDKLNHSYSMITLSEHGVYAFDGEKGQIIPTTPRKIRDVCGAGDTVISIAALGIALSLDLGLIARFANYAGGQVCEKVGVVQVDKQQLLKELIYSND